MGMSNYDRSREVERDFIDRRVVWLEGGPSPKLRHRTLKLYEADRRGEDERECRNCEETFPIEDFWTGFVLSFYCDRCRPKRKKRRQKMERDIAAENRKNKRRGPVSAVKEKASGAVKGALAAPAAKMAGKAVQKPAESLLGEDLGAAAGQMTQKVVREALAS